MRNVLLAAVAAAVALAAAPNASAWMWPADGPVLRPFVLGDDPYAGGQHRGIDIGVEADAIVRAPAGGEVTFAGSLPRYGKSLTIRTLDGYAVTLLHLGVLVVSRGGAVQEGQAVGRGVAGGDGG
jgi:septal ring factor EnvC (AmiA/AmiB activator)